MKAYWAALYAKHPEGVKALDKKLGYVVGFQEPHGLGMDAGAGRYIKKREGPNDGYVSVQAQHLPPDRSFPNGVGKTLAILEMGHSTLTRGFNLFNPFEGAKEITLQEAFHRAFITAHFGSEPPPCPIEELDISHTPIRLTEPVFAMAHGN